MSGAARVTNVRAERASDGFTDSTNGNWTYKLGANWEVTDWLRFRGTYGTSFRAPALFEQFLADETGFPSQRAIDPCVQWGVNLAHGNITQADRRQLRRRTAIPSEPHAAAASPPTSLHRRRHRRARAGDLEGAGRPASS